MDSLLCDKNIPIENKLMRVLMAAINHYLSSTKFGISSFYYHGINGMERAEKIKLIIEQIESERRIKSIWPLLWTILNSKAGKLKLIITERIILSGIIGDDLYTRVELLKRKLSESEARVEAIKQYSFIKCINNPENDRGATELLSILDTKGKPIDKVLISKLDLVKPLNINNG